MRTRLRLLALAGLLACMPAPAAKMMYSCTTGAGPVTIQDHPCGDAADQQKSYATPDAGRSAGPRAGPARTRQVDFGVACRSLNEERIDVIGAITASTDPRQTARLQQRLRRIGQAQCTAHCSNC